MRLLFPIFFLISLFAVSLTLRRIEFDRHYNAALVAWTHQDFTAVVRESYMATDEGVFRYNILHMRGVAHLNLGNFHFAATAFRQTLELAPNAWYVHEGLGMAHLRLGRNAEALRHYETALKLCPSATFIRNNIGVVYAQIGDRSKAKKIFEQVLADNPDDEKAKANMEILNRGNGNK